MESLGLKDAAELHPWLMSHCTRYLATKGRRAIGWDEILADGIDVSTAIMSWQGVEGGQKALVKGHEVVFTPVGYCYFDHPQHTVDDGFGYFPAAPVTLLDIYAYNPCDEGLEKVLGVQGNLWTERLVGREVMLYKLFPRALAIAEIAWTSPRDKNPGSFFSRVKKGLELLDNLGVKGAPISPGEVVVWKAGMTCETIELAKPAGDVNRPLFVAFLWTRGGTAKVKRVEVVDGKRVEREEKVIRAEEAAVFEIEQDPSGEAKALTFQICGEGEHSQGEVHFYQ
jgi:hypothetical protein